ncbi:MAG: hypothetical protein EHM35_08390 [Planctomycetaceae bacterium]|nr:MAG: hypothetical protein EHM35_08390 [Planctomycetaceae bacterium]
MPRREYVNFFVNDQRAAHFEQIAAALGIGSQEHSNRVKMLEMALEAMANRMKGNTTMNEKQAGQLAAKIYPFAYPDVDSKGHRQEKVQQIADWLRYGDGGEGRTAEQLAAEWLEYDAE